MQKSNTNSISERIFRVIYVELRSLVRIVFVLAILASPILYSEIRARPRTRAFCASIAVPMSDKDITTAAIAIGLTASAPRFEPPKRKSRMYVYYLGWKFSRDICTIDLLDGRVADLADVKLSEYEKKVGVH